MKKSVLFLAFIATFGMLSCTKEGEEQIVPTVKFDFNASITATKAVFGGQSGSEFPLSWESDDKLKLVANNSPISGEFTLDSDNKFKADISEATEYVFQSMYPADGFKSFSKDNGFNVVIPPYQNSTPESPDHSAIVLAAYNKITGVPSSTVDLSFNHLTAYLHFKLTNLDAITSSPIKSVTVTHKGSGDNDYLADRVYFKYNDSNNTWTKEKNSMTKSVIVATSTTESIWCAVSPVDLKDQTLGFTVTTGDGYSYSKDVTFGSDEKFNLSAGQVATFTVNLNKSGKEATLDELEEYELLTDAANLASGDQILIVSRNGYDYAISTAQNSYNRGQFYVSVDRTNGIIVNPSASVERFTVETTDGGFYFKTSAGRYLYYKTGTANANNLYSDITTVSQDQKWTVTIEDVTDERVTDIVNNGKHISYNFDSSIFAAYSNNNETSNRCHVQIYKKKTPSLGVDVTSANIGSEEPYNIAIASNISWTAEVSSGAILSEGSGNGTATITVTPEAYTELDTREITVTITPDPRAKLPTKTVTLTQYGRLWYEDWNGGSAGQAPSTYLTSERKAQKVLGDGSELSYSFMRGSNTSSNAAVKLYADGMVYLVNGKGTGDENIDDYLEGLNKMNLMINGNQSDGSGDRGEFRVAGIPCKDVKTAKLVFRTNTNLSTNHAVEIVTSNVTIGGMTKVNASHDYNYEGEGQSKKYYTISYNIDLKDCESDTFSLTFPNNSNGSNIRVTDFEIIVLEMK